MGIIAGENLWMLKSPVWHTYVRDQNCIDQGDRTNLRKKLKDKKNENKQYKGWQSTNFFTKQEWDHLLIHKQENFMRHTNQHRKIS